MRRETAQHQVVQPDPHLVVGGERRGRLRVEDGAQPGEHGQRPEVAGVRGTVRVDEVHEHQLGRDHGGVARGVVRPGVLVGVVAQVDDELAVADLHGDAVDRAAVLLLVEAVGPLRKLCERASRELLAAVHRDVQRLPERVDPVLDDELADPPLADARGRDPRPHVAPEEVRQPAVARHDLEHRPDRLALRDQLHSGQPQPLLEDLARVRRDGAWDHSADVVPVRDVRGPRDELARREHRQREHDVIQMRDAAVERIVRDVNVARADLVVQLEDPPHRLVEHADERRDACTGRREVALGVGDAGAHVEHLVDDCAHRRLPQRGEHLVARRLHGALDDLERDRIAHSRPYTARAVSSVT